MVAHEIAHFKRDHIFKESYHKHHNLKGYSEKNKNTELMRFSRQQELEADRDAADMVARAGLSGRVCQDDIRFMHHSVGDGSATGDDSTHPGYEERLAAMKQHYDTRGAEPLSPVLGRPARLSYDPEDNLLTLTPHRR
jgi:predicted Zn-dependent protease